MANILQWIGFAFGAAVVGLGVYGFFRGLSLSPNAPEHRPHGNGDNSDAIQILRNTRDSL
jgi:hypothetical protein